MRDFNRRHGWRHHLYEVIFEADTQAGKTFDVALLVFIVLSVFTVMLESVASIRADHGVLLRRIEWSLTLLFTVEYVLRLISIGKPLRYALSFYGVIDLLSILPTYLSIFIAGSQSLLVIRALRLMRTFRVLKMVHFVGEAQLLRTAMQASFRKILVFLLFILTLVMILGSLMYLVEGSDSGFRNIPISIYWAIVTMTTVGYGDLAPVTVAGRVLASVIMILGYAIIAVPTGIVTVSLADAHRRGVTTQACPQCSGEGHDPDARHCKHCGAAL